MNPQAAYLKSQITNLKFRAFTLVELLVVVAIIVILISLLMPAMESAFDMARRAKCASQQRSIHIASVAYATNSNGLLLICRGRSVQIAFSPLGDKITDNTDSDAATDWPNALASVGLASTGKYAVGNGSTALDHNPSKIWDCPARNFSSFWDANHSQLVVGYQYFGGLMQWRNPYVTIMPSRSPDRLNTAEPGWALTADITVKNDGVWGYTDPAWTVYYPDIPAHKSARGSAPAGHNQSYINGSAEWVEATRLVDIGNWFGNTTHQMYWYQEDLGGWVPPAAAYAVPP